ncbi:hypothetical protein PC128_g4889 [Phytophthora cactorum]|nr:hypothetical protein PC128_g4889 [Phytophthora cactorum]
MTRMNKGFAYVFNTPREDRKVAQVYSGQGADESPVAVDVAVIDHGAQERLVRLQELLFASCVGLKDHKLKVSRRVIGVLTAYLIKHFPVAKALEPRSLFVARVEECLDAVEIPVPQSKDTEQKNGCNGSAYHHTAVTNELIESNRLMSARLLVLEAAILKLPVAEEITEGTQQEQVSSAQALLSKRRKKAATNLSSIWFEWYPRQPRIWISSDRQKKSDYRLVVTYMKLFYDGGFQIREGSEDYKDRLLEVGQRAESVVLAFLSGQEIRAKGGDSVLREMCKLHLLGALDDRIIAYRTQLNVENIIGPAPTAAQNILQVAGHV